MHGSRGPDSGPTHAASARIELTTSLLHLHFTFTYDIRHCSIVLMLSNLLNVFLFLTPSGIPDWVQGITLVVDGVVVNS